MKKFLLALAGLALMSGAYAYEVTWIPSECNFSNGKTVGYMGLENVVELFFDKGSNSNAPAYYTTGAALRLYGGNTMTVKGKSGITITKMVMDAPSGSTGVSAASTVDAGELAVDNGVATWTGSVNTFTFTEGGSTGHARIRSIVITYEVEGEAPVIVDSPVFTPDGGIVDKGTEVAVTAANAVYVASEAEVGASPTAEDVFAHGTNTNSVMVESDCTFYAVAADAEGNLSSVTKASFVVIEPGEFLFVDWIFPGAAEWTSKYEEHVVSYRDATVTFASANKQTSTITDCPVTKGQPITVALTDTSNHIASFSAEFAQWGTKEQTVAVLTSTDGENFTETEITSADFAIAKTTFDTQDIVAIQFSFSSPDNQIGIRSIRIDEKSTVTALEGISADAVAAEYYTLQGIRVAADRLQPGLYIERRAGRASKVRIR